MRIACSALAVVTLVACAPDPVSPCYAPAPYTYAGQVRTVGQLPAFLNTAIASPDGRALAIVFDFVGPASLAYRAYLIDPASDSVEQVAAWDGGHGPTARLADGRLLHFTNSDCTYVLVDPDASGEVTTRTCDVENLSVELMWQDPSGELLLFGHHDGDGLASDGTVFKLDIEAATMTRLDTQVEHGFLAPPDQPFPLCDGRLFFPHTRLDGGDFVDDAEAVHYFDPATQQLTSVTLPFAPEHAAQLDATTALLLGTEDSFTEIFARYDLETGELRAIDPPADELSPGVSVDPLVGLADGTALVVAESGAIHVYTPETGRFAAAGARFTGAPRRLLRLATGPVLAFTVDAQIEIYE